MDDDACHVLIRFGLGRRGDQPPPSDVHAWISNQLDSSDPVLASPEPSTASAIYARIHHDDPDKRNPGPHLIGDLFDKCRADAFRNALATDLPFRERLVHFWSNHFTVSAKAGGDVLALIGAYVHEAIRPHVTGRFEDMLRAVMHHPGMLYYLSNNDSIGPDSKFGRAVHGGLNENLARESLELHTVGLKAGYTQTDVTSYAKLITGWGTEMKADSPGFVFRADRHEPGPETVMGQTYPDGELGGEVALHTLAYHPATYRHIATQLVQHFVADDPPPDDVAAIAKVLDATGGDLKAATLAVTRLPGAWVPLTKLRSPVDYVIAVCRALGVEDGVAGLRACDYLGQTFWGPPLPNGWGDTAADWTGGEALVRRADWSWRMAAARTDLSPDTVAANTLGELMGDETRTRIGRAATRLEGLALLLSSPEFMRR